MLNHELPHNSPFTKPVNPRVSSPPCAQGMEPPHCSKQDQRREVCRVWPGIQVGMERELLSEKEG